MCNYFLIEPYYRLLLYTRLMKASPSDGLKESVSFIFIQVLAFCSPTSFEIPILYAKTYCCNQGIEAAGTLFLVDNLNAVRSIIKHTIDCFPRAFG